MKFRTQKRKTSAASPGLQEEQLRQVSKKALRQSIRRQIKSVGVGVVLGVLAVLCLNALSTHVDDKDFFSLYERSLNEACCYAPHLTFDQVCQETFLDLSRTLPTRSDGSFLHQLSIGATTILTSSDEENRLLRQEQSLIRVCPGIGFVHGNIEDDDAAALGRLLEMAIVPPNDFAPMNAEHRWDDVATKWQEAVRSKTPANLASTFRVLLSARSAGLARAALSAVHDDDTRRVFNEELSKIKPIFAAELWIAWAQHEDNQKAFLAALDENFKHSPRFLATIDDVISWAPSKEGTRLRRSRLSHLAEGTTLSKIAFKTAQLVGKAATTNPFLEKQLGERRQISWRDEASNEKFEISTRFFLWEFAIAEFPAHRADACQRVLRFINGRVFSDQNVGRVLATRCRKESQAFLEVPVDSIHSGGAYLRWVLQTLLYKEAQ